MAGNAVAATSDTFTITVTCNFLDIVLKDHDGADYVTWAVGQQATSAAVTMTHAQGIQVVNTSNASTDISAWVTTTGAWTPDTAAGADKYVLELESFGTVQEPVTMGTPTKITATSSTGTEFKTGLGATTDQFVYGRFTVPSSTTTGAQQTITVTILASLAT
jgi:hypothetical protein